MNQTFWRFFLRFVCLFCRFSSANLDFTLSSFRFCCLYSFK
ncbi:hypothetical protein HMPREF9441_02036 [Paraprevotella clara YIT 11840]|uniref:Uncharacterized protein n=1 Tax=Paraprevotella clara YIT 11840 TaxID=762968 RepID=G5SRP3_9BACT|nr:hypothetical protein HMPREF9441_02036 [Paraprevotella clara YIT 11840]